MKHIVLFFLIFYVLQVSSSEFWKCNICLRKKEKDTILVKNLDENKSELEPNILNDNIFNEPIPSMLVQVLQQYHLFQIIMNFLLFPQDSQLLVKPLCKSLYTKVKDLLQRKVDTFMFEKIMTSPIELENNNLAANYIRFYQEDMHPDIENMNNEPMKKIFKYTKSENMLTFFIMTRGQSIHYTIEDHQWYRSNFEEDIFYHKTGPSLFPVCFLISDQKNNLYLFRMSNLDEVEVSNDHGHQEWIDDLFGNPKLDKEFTLTMHLKRYITYLIPHIFEETTEEVESYDDYIYVYFQIGGPTDEFEIRNNNYTLLQVLYWDNHTNHIKKGNIKTK